MDDLELLRQYAQEGSKEAFAELVRRHADLVYSAARRQVTDAHQAEDAVQAVFVLLTQKSHKVRGSLAGWLIQSTYFVCRNSNKLAARRRFHERGAALMRPENSQSAISLDKESLGEQPVWENYSNVLDEAMAKLRPLDRDAVVLRYLRGMSLRDVGAALGVGEDAARKRVDRSVERLRQAVSAKAAVPAAAVLVMHLTAHGVQAAPVGLVQSITSAVATGTLASSTLKAIIMSTKVKLAYTTGVVLAALLLGVGTVKLVTSIASSDTPTAPPSERIAQSPPQSLTPSSNPPVARTNRAMPWQGYPMRTPFSAVKWTGQTPQVQVGVNWYELTAIDSIPVDQIISFDQNLPQGAGADYRKHFQEDLVELMSLMGHAPGATVALSVNDPVTGKDQVLQNIAMTAENRYTMLAAARRPGAPLPPRPEVSAATQPASAAESANASTEPQLEFRPVNPIASTMPTTLQVARWDFLLKQSAAEAIEKIGKPIVTQSNLYEGRTCSAIEIRRAVANIIASGGRIAEGERMEIGQTDLVTQQFGTRSLFLHYPQTSRTSPNVTGIPRGTEKFLIRPDGKLGVTINDLFRQVTTIDSGRGVIQTPNVSIQFDGELGAGDAVAFMAEFPGPSKAVYEQLTVWEIYKGTEMDRQKTVTVRSAEWWIKNGPETILKMSAVAADWESHAVHPGGDVPADFVKTLSDGKQLKLVALGRPEAARFCWWDAHGQPVSMANFPQDPGITSAPANGLYAVVSLNGDTGEMDHLYPATRPATVRNNNPNNMIYERPLVIRVAQPETQLNVAVPVGEWQEAGQIDVDTETPLAGAKFRIVPPTSAPNGRDFRVQFVQTGEADNLVAITAVGPDGKEADDDQRFEMLDVSPKLPGSSRYISFRNIQLIDVQYFRLCQRKREAVTFTGFATKPVIPLPAN